MMENKVICLFYIGREEEEEEKDIPTSGDGLGCDEQRRRSCKSKQTSIQSIKRPRELLGRSPSDTINQRGVALANTG